MSNDNLPKWVHSAIDDGVELYLRNSKEPGHLIVRRALAQCRAELIAVLGPKGAVHTLRALADNIEAD